MHYNSEIKLRTFQHNYDNTYFGINNNNYGELEVPFMLIYSKETFT